MIKDSTKRFSDKVDYYDKFRPRYPKKLIGFLESETGLNAASVIADIGSGTGISSEIFLKNGNTVFAVEPNDEMRNAAEMNFRTFQNFVSIKGTAEHTSLDHSGVDFIVCAQSFHWFNNERSRREFLRILKPEGWLILVWNERKTSGSGFLKEYDELLIRVSDDYENINHTNITNASLDIFEDFFGKGKVFLKVFYNEQVFDMNGLKGRTLSCSYVPREGHPDYNIMMKGLEELFEKYNEKGKVKFEYDTKVFYGRL